jgi:hypothetical protein
MDILCLECAEDHGGWGRGLGFVNVQLVNERDSNHLTVITFPLVSNQPIDIVDIAEKIVNNMSVSNQPLDIVDIASRDAVQHNLNSTDRSSK